MVVYRMQVNGVDVRGVRGSMAKRLLGKMATQRITKINLNREKIGPNGAAEAVAAMLLWSASALTELSLRYTDCHRA